MASRYRIGVLGLSHDHVWDHLPDVVAHPRAELVAAADPHQELIGRAELEFGARPYTSPDILLDSEQLDAVYVFSDNAAGPELTEAAAARKLHVLIEKPMAASQAGAKRMLTAAEDAGIRLMVNWPFAWWPQLQHAVRLAQDGSIGAVWQVRYRAAHAGPQELGCSKYFCEWLFDPERNGPGGAYMDYCCYGALLARAILGVPSTVAVISGRFLKTDIDVDDNAILTMKYPHALAISEGSWTQIGKMTAYSTVIYGTQGTLMVEPRDGGRLLLANDDNPQGEPLEVPTPDESMSNATHHFLDRIEKGQAFWELCDAKHGYDTQAILEAGIRSLAEKWDEPVTT